MSNIFTPFIDTGLSIVRKPIEDIIYDILDLKNYPSRAEFRELKIKMEKVDERFESLNGELNKIREKLNEISKMIHEYRAPKKRGRKPRVPKVDSPVVQEAEAKEAKTEEKPAAPKKRGRKPNVDNICKVPGCGRKTRSRGFCETHYRKWLKNSLPGFPFDKSMLQNKKGKKIEKVEKTEEVKTKVEGTIEPAPAK